MSGYFPSKALVRKELLTLLRRKRAVLMVALVVICAIFSTLAFWPDGYRTSLGASTSRDLLAALAWVFMISSLLFIPSLAATSITAEKERQTYGQLRLTLISPAGILAAKLANVLGFFFLLMIGAMPIAGAIFFLVGIDWIAVATVFILVIVSAISCASAGVMCSAFFRKSATSVFVSYILMILLTGFPTIMFLALLVELRIFSPSGNAPLFIFYISSPQFVMGASLYGSSGTSLAYTVLYQLAWSMIFLLLARRAIFRPPEPPKVDLRKPIDDPEVLEQRRKRFPFYLVDPLRRKKCIESYRNPMLVKELRWGLTGRRTWLIRIFYIFLIVYLALCVNFAFWGGFGYSRQYFEALTVFMLVQIVATVVVAPAMLASSITKEHELGNMDFLRSTLLTPREIVMGKVAAGLINLAPMLLASFIVGLILLLFVSTQTAHNSGAFERLFCGYVTLATCTLLSLGICMFASLLAKRTSTSLMLGYLFSILIYAGFTCIIFIIGEAYGARGNDLEGLAAFFSPIFAYGCVPELRDWRNNTIFGMSIYWIFSMQMFAVLGVGFLGLTSYGFKRYRMRDK